MSDKLPSFHGFKNWMSQQKELSVFFNVDDSDSNDKFIGKSCCAKVAEQKLLDNIDTNGSADQLINDFLDNDGVIMEIEDKRILIEVESGTFWLPKFCVKPKKD